MENSTRNFVKIIKEICIEEAIEMRSFSYDWIFKLHKNGVFNYIIGYQFGLNNSSVHSICCDKSAASEIMTSFDIPNVEHYFFMSPIAQKYVGQHGSWNGMLDLLNKHEKLVCKANQGTGGNQVYCVTNQYELEKAVFNIFKKSRSLAISPYYEIENEYRIIVLNGEIKLIYTKQRPNVVGDGVSNIGTLIYQLIENGNQFSFEDIDEETIKTVLEKDEIYYLNWKHNLGQGAHAVIETSSDIANNIKDIVAKIVNCMNIKFASIDIIKTNSGYKVLEINSGVMMEHFSQQDNNTYNIAKQIYKEAIISMLE